MKRNGDCVSEKNDLKIKLYLQKKGILRLFDDDIGNMSEPLKWNEHEDDMKELSINFPKILFILEGFGEESMDIWKKYFVDGKVQIEEATIIIGGFNPEKLK